jgi:glycosyltransferase involved in cell wall biosynthesis
VKILQILPSANPRAGGPVEAVTQTARVLIAQGHVVEVVSLDSPEEAFLKEYPTRIYALGPTRGNYLFTNKLVGWLRGNAAHYDAVIINGIWQFNCFGAWLALRNSTTPYYVFAHGMLDPWFKRAYPLKHLKKWLYWPWGVYPALRDARAVLFTCEEERLLARESFWLYRVTERVVKFGTATPPQDQRAAREAFLSSFPELRERRVLLFLSRIHQKKGCDMLIEAFARVRALEPSLHLMIAGSGEEMLVRDLKELASRLGVSEHITWSGMLTGPAKWSAFYNSEVFVLPSHQENFGIAVVEALACGLPVLISRNINIWREVDAEGAGMIEEDTVEGTERNLRRYLSLTLDDRTAYRARALSAFAKLFTIDAACSSLLTALQPAVA